MATYPRNPRTHVTDVRSVPTERAQAPSFGSVAVAEYVKAGGKADRTQLGILGHNALALRRKGAPEDAVLRAIREFAHTNRWPQYVGEWTTEIEVGDDIARHLAEKKSHRASARKTMSSIAEQLKKAGLVA